MGCCCSRTVDDDALSHAESMETPLPQGGNRPFSKAAVSWRADPPITLEQLKKKRDEFWETAPIYGGHSEIWLALKAACEAEDMATAQIFIDTVNVTIPTGNLVDGCYDELGHHYKIDNFCITEPTNLIKDEEDERTSQRSDDTSAKLLGQEEGPSADRAITVRLSNSSKDERMSQRSDDTSAKLLGQEEGSPADRTITVRISNSSKDVLLRFNPHSDSVATLREKLCKQEDLDIERTNVRFFFLGRMLDDKTNLADVKFDENQLLQANVTEKP